MTILPSHTQRIIRNRGMAALYGIAAEHDCDLSDVLDILVTAPFSAPESTTPSQPEVLTHATAAQTDGAAGVLPTEPSVDLSGLADREQGPSTQLPSQGNAPEPESLSTKSGPSGSGDFLPRISVGARVVKCHEEHPDWPAKVIADHLGLSRGSVSAHASLNKISLPSQRDYDAALKAQTTEALKAPPAKPQEALGPPPAPEAQPEPEQPPASKPRKRTGPTIKQRVFDLYDQHPGWSAKAMAEHIGANLGTVKLALIDAKAAARGSVATEPVPAATPQTPVGLPPARAGSLTDRVRALHHQHPTWTARMIANELGENANSVSTLLAKVRGTTNPAPSQKHQFTGRADMLNHYSEVAKRLGKGS